MGDALGSIGSDKNVPIQENDRSVYNQTDPANITTQQDDYNPGDGTFFRITSTGAQTITGLAPTGGNVAGRKIVIHNANASAIISFATEDANSAAANRIKVGVSLTGQRTLEFVYDGTSSRWVGVI